MRYRTKLLVAVLIAPSLTILFFFVCYLWLYHPNGTVWPIQISEIEERFRGKKGVRAIQQEPDNAVLNAVLHDLLTYTGDDSPVLSDRSGRDWRLEHPGAAAHKTQPHPENQPAAFLRFTPRFCPKSVSFFQINADLLNENIDYPAGAPHTNPLPADRMNQAREAFRHLEYRVALRQETQDFLPEDTKRILLPNQKIPPELRGKGASVMPNDASSLQAWPPGYTNDGKTAIVVISIPRYWGIANGLYLLTKEKGEWIVLRRKFFYYG